MRKALAATPLMALLALLPAQARATGGLVCRTAGARPIEITLVIGHTAISSVVQAHLRVAGTNVPVRVAQSWLDPKDLRLDLVDANALVHELRLRAVRTDLTYDGTLWRGGVRQWVRCRED